MPVGMDEPGQRAALLSGPPLLVLCTIAMVARWGRHHQDAERARSREEAP